MNHVGSTSADRSRSAGVALIAVIVLAALIPVSLPASAGGSFTDDDDSAHESAIDYIASKGVTLGCNPPSNTKYCPDRSITRAEMAVFLQRAFDLPSGEKDRFIDDDDSPFESAINSVGKAGISLGCNPPDNDEFCPHDSVTRGEMAAFLNRALGLEGGGDFFTDDNSSVFEADINAVARVGITKGCNPPENSNYCVGRPVTRAEMATFMMRSMQIVTTGTTTTIKPPTTTPPGNPPPPPPSSSECVGVPWPGPPNPTGDVTIQPGQSIQAAVDSHGEGTRFVIAAGVHSNQKVSPKNDNAFVGEPGAILDGGGTTEYAFGGPGDDVLIEGLEIRNYNSDLQAGVIRSVNQALDWTVRANDIHDNGGQGVTANPGWHVVGNYLHHNEQFGVAGTGKNIVVEYNEIAYNNEDRSVSAFWAAGGTKFLRTADLIVRGNCSHHNGGPGLWTDGHNVNTLYELNLVFDNDHAGIKHEISCDALIQGNTAIGNGFENDNWLAGAGILVSNSPNVVVIGNHLIDNHDGVGAIQGVRDQPDEQCQIDLKNLLVTDNVIEMSDGHTGIVTNETSDVFSSGWNNRFTNNDYTLKPSGGEFFRWKGEVLTLSEWKALGQG